MTTDNFCFYLQNRLIQTSQTGGQWYSDTSPFSIPWLKCYITPGLMACQGHTLSLTGLICKLQRNWSVVNASPGAYPSTLVSAVDYNIHAFVLKWIHYKRPQSSLGQIYNQIQCLGQYYKQLYSRNLQAGIISCMRPCCYGRKLQL